MGGSRVQLESRAEWQVWDWGVLDVGLHVDVEGGDGTKTPPP